MKLFKSLITFLYVVPRNLLDHVLATWYNIIFGYIKDLKFTLRTIKKYVVYSYTSNKWPWEIDTEVDKYIESDKLLQQKIRKVINSQQFLDAQKEIMDQVNEMVKNCKMEENK